MRFNLFSFFKSFSFFSGVLKTLAVLVCVGVGFYFENISVGLISALTIIMISPSDIPGNRKHHFLGIIIATIFVITSSVSINLTYGVPYLLLPIMFLLVFCYGFLSLYGNRASMVAIAGIFSISLTFAQLSTGSEIFRMALYQLGAGIFYIFLVQCYMWLYPRQYSEQLLGKCMLHTAEFLKLRAQLLTETHRESYIQQLINLQTLLNEEFEKLREVLLNSQSKSGKTNYLQRQFLLFIELVDIYEWTISNPISYEKLDAYCQDEPDFLAQYQQMILLFSEKLAQISLYIGYRKKLPQEQFASASLQELKNTLKNTSFPEKNTFLNALYHYLETQISNIENIENIFVNYYTDTLPSHRDESTFRRFVTSVSYSPRRLADHFSFQSPFFRYALRLAIVTLIGYCIGELLDLQNAYWILFTIFVIMRPAYVVTKKRSYDRIQGTIIGALIAALIIFVCQYWLKIEHYSIIYGVIILLCMPFAYGLLQENFSLCVVFITLYIMLGYALFHPNTMEVIGYRIIDTLIGVVLAVLANLWLFPVWENDNYQKLLHTSIGQISQYVTAIQHRYHSESQQATTDYKVARKKAFLALAHLNSAFQRMLQEPKSKQKNASQIHRLVVLEHDFLASLAGFVLQFSGKKSLFATDVFDQYISEIQMNLARVQALSSQASENPSLVSEKTLPKGENTEALSYLYHLSQNLVQAMAQITPS